jgi:hypothetical protein
MSSFSHALPFLYQNYSYSHLFCAQDVAQVGTGFWGGGKTFAQKLAEKDAAVAAAKTKEEEAIAAAAEAQRKSEEQVRRLEEEKQRRVAEAARAATAEAEAAEAAEGFRHTSSSGWLPTYEQQRPAQQEKVTRGRRKTQTKNRQKHLFRVTRTMFLPMLPSRVLCTRFERMRKLSVRGAVWGGFGRRRATLPASAGKSANGSAHQGTPPEGYH